jgi:hypothetical protein
MSVLVFRLLALISLSIPAVLFWHTGFPIYSFFSAAILTFWIYSQNRGWQWSNHMVLVVGVALNAFSALLINPHLWILFSTTFLLISWDYFNYLLFLKKADSKDKILKSEKQHFLNISLFIGAAVGMSTFSVFIELKTTFLISIILVILTTIGLLQLFRWLKISTGN